MPNICAAKWVIQKYAFLSYVHPSEVHSAVEQQNSLI